MECFKPLRNHLRKLNLTSLLQAIWHLSVHLEFGHPLPRYLAAAHPLGKDKWSLGFYLWELDTLAREALLHCDQTRGLPVDSWWIVAALLNKQKRTEEAAYIPTDGNVLYEVSRIAHRQFHWQRGIHHGHLARARILYRHSAMDDAVRHVYGLSAEQVAVGGFTALSVYMKHFALSKAWLPNATAAIGFDPSSILDNLTSTYSALRLAADQARSLDENWAYAFNPLWQHPLIELNDGRRICPLPGLLIRRFTDGLYFDVAKHDIDVLSAHLGPAFQSYIGEVIERSNRGNYRVFPEERYGSKAQPKDTVDWIVADETGSLFVEVKLLKMGKVAKEVLAPHESVVREFKKLARAVGQIYATIEDARNGKYPTWKPNNLPVHPLIVTLDDWNLFTHTIQNILTDLIREELVRRKLDPELVNSNRYVICSVDEFESAIQVMGKAGVHTVMEGVTSGPKADWLLEGHLRNEFPEELKLGKALFPEERNALLRVVKKGPDC